MDAFRCNFLGAGIDVNSITESELMNAQWQWNQQIAQSEQLVNQIMAQSGQQLNTSTPEATKTTCLGFNHYI